MKTWGVKVVVMVCSGHLRARRGAGAAGSASRAPGAARAAAGEVPAPRPRFASIVHLAWWDGVSHVVTRPTREHVT